MAMKTTAYFLEALGRPDRAGITDELCAKIVREARYTERQEGDRRWRFYGYVTETPVGGGRWIRVVTESDRVTLHNAIYDRRFSRRLARGDFGEAGQREGR